MELIARCLREEGHLEPFLDRWHLVPGEPWQEALEEALDGRPSRQAQNSAVRLSNFLKADGIQQWVEAAAIWANRASPLTVENPMVAV